MRILNKKRFLTPEHYLAYQYEFTENHLLPLLIGLNVPLNRPILDVGCGRGGISIKLAETLEVAVTGIDYQEDRISIARNAASNADISIDFKLADLTKAKLGDELFGLMIMHDVIEHLSDIHSVMSILRKHIHNEGFLYLSFPPWRSPYGGHQHNASSFVRYMPYLHVISSSLFYELLIPREPPDRKKWAESLPQIGENKMSLRKLKQIAAESSWGIYYSKTYLIRPELFRSGLPTFSNGFFGRIPFIGDFLTSGCECVLVPA